MRGKGSSNFRVPNHVCGEANGGVYHIAVGGGGKHPNDASGVCLATGPVDASVFENPARYSRYGKWNFGSFLGEGGMKHDQNHPQYLEQRIGGTEELV